MILFIFEGRKTEPNLFKTIEKLYFATAKTPNMKHGARTRISHQPLQE